MINSLKTNRRIVDLSQANIFNRNAPNNSCEFDHCLEPAKYLKGRKINPDWVKFKFNSQGLTLINEFTHSHEYLEYLCSEGHRNETTLTNFLQGRRCRKCHVYTKAFTQKYVHDFLNEHGYTLRDTYINARKKIDVSCPEGHNIQIVFQHFITGSRCRFCKGTELDIKTIDSFITSIGYKRLSPYINHASPMTLECSNKHKIKMTWNKLNGGRRCSVCSGSRIDKEKLITVIQQEGYKIVEWRTHIKGTTKNLTLICPKGHEWEVCSAKFFKGTRCGKCFMNTLENNFTITGNRIFHRIKRLSSISKEELLQICITLITKELQDFYNKTPKGYHVDHIIPVSYFDFNDVHEIQACWSLDNLRYLPALDNMSRCNRMTRESFDSLQSEHIKILKVASRTPENIKHWLNK